MPPITNLCFESYTGEKSKLWSAAVGVRIELLRIFLPLHFAENAVFLPLHFYNPAANVTFVA
jgi:hypothetical protein